MTIDVSAFVGGYPFREVPHPDPVSLVQVLGREGLSGALVGYLPAAWQRSPVAANDALLRALEPYREKLVPVPVVNPLWPAWKREIERVRFNGAPAVRAYPPQWGLGESDARMSDLASACAESEMTLILTVRFEDSRQRHWMDSAADLSAAAIRTASRAHGSAHVIVTAAGRSLIEEVHWSLTPAERARVWYDISCVWGPPAGDLAHLFSTIGPDRFLFGSMWPLRLIQAPFCNLELAGVGGPEALAELSAAVPRLELPSSGGERS